jgi:hypothetical protein
MRKIIQYIYVCSKYHDDGSLCVLEKCMKHHWIKLTPAYLTKNDIEYGNSIIYELDPKIFDIYDTDEIIGFGECAYD